MSRPKDGARSAFVPHFLWALGMFFQSSNDTTAISKNRQAQGGTTKPRYNHAKLDPIERQEGKGTPAQSWQDKVDT